MFLSYRSLIFSVLLTASVAQCQISNLRHIIFELQENRSFDHYFGRLGDYRVSRGLTNDIDSNDLNTPQMNYFGESILPYHFRTVCHEGLDPQWNASHFYFDGGLMDNFMMEANPTNPSDIDTHYNRPMGYYDARELPYYYELATQFATSDRFFASVLGGTIPNRMYMFTATSFGHIQGDRPPDGGWPQKTIFELLDQYGIEWRYYQQNYALYLSEFSIYQNAADRARIRDISEYYDILSRPTADQDLAPVVFIERGVFGWDEHDPDDIQYGIEQMKRIIDALLASSAWPSSVFILSYDEAGGHYDHVSPVSFPAPDDIAPILGPYDTPGDFRQSGFRVPVTVISPWIRPHFVSHTPREFTSILKLIETRFGLPPLTRRDAAADDMTEFFDFSNPSLLNPPPLPDQPTDAPCDFNLETAPR